jgi:hypothetical protein
MLRQVRRAGGVPNAPAVKVLGGATSVTLPMSCGWSSSNSWKSAAFKSVSWRPALSRTMTSTTTTAVVAAPKRCWSDDGGVAGACCWPFTWADPA